MSCGALFLRADAAIMRHRKERMAMAAIDEKIGFTNAGKVPANCGLRIAHCHGLDDHKLET